LVVVVVAFTILAPLATASVRVTKAPGRVSAGDYATVTVAVSRRARCTIGVYYTTRISEAAGLNSKTAAKITWRWRVGTNTKPGRFPVKIDCGKSGKAQTTISVTD
jgi:hypothetical protein